MKKILMMLAVASFGMIAISCEDDEQVISASKLPTNAQSFIQTHFTGAIITRVVKDTEGGTEYDVRLDNGFKLEFNKSGNWREVEGYGIEIPASFIAELPTGIPDYITANHATQTLTKIELNKASYEVELTGGLELIFDASGTFVRYDD